MTSGKIFLLDDDELIVTMLSRALKKDGYQIKSEIKTKDVVDKIKLWSPDVVMLDINMPEKSGIDILQELRSQEIDTQVVMLSADDTAETAVRAMKLGAADYLTKPFNMDEVRIVISNIIENHKLKHEVEYYRNISSQLFEKELLGASNAIKDLKAKGEKIAQAHVSSVLITGESGTGKELVARYIHCLMHGDSTRGYAPFRAVNCTALPDTLLESELFGYEKGSFTDAKSDKKGVFELADGGSILLDEIGDMKPNLQSKLLRVLEERTVRRIGGNAEIPIDVTVIATTNTDIQSAIEKGEFRMDLFYRLNAFSLFIPPLRDRKEDIMLLARHFLSKFTLKYKNQKIRDFSPEAEKHIRSYRWPGNVRELKNVIERIVVLENTEFILPEHLPREILSQPAISGFQPKDKFVLPETGISLDDIEKDLIIQALDRANNNKTLAAKLLNISYDSLRYQIKKFRLDQE
jgi:DNA-binding NtrC family response regulator